MPFNYTQFQEAVKNLIENLLQLIDAAEAIRECETFINSAENRNFENYDIQQNCDVGSIKSYLMYVIHTLPSNVQVLIDQGKRLLKRCNRLIEYCGQEHWQRHRATINNEMRTLRQEINQYQAQIDQFKPIVKTFGLQIYEEIKKASVAIRHGNNAIIGQGINVVGSTLTLMISLSAGGILGGVLTLGSVAYGSIKVKAGFEAHNASKDAMKIKEDYTTTLNSIEEKYRELCEQHVAVRSNIARCELVATQ